MTNARRAVAVLFLAAAAGCRSTARSTGDFTIAIPGAERAMDINSSRATVRVLNRGICPVAVLHGGREYLLHTSEDKELVVAGEQVIRFERRGEGEGVLEVHFVTEGRINTVNLR